MQNFLGDRGSRLQSLIAPAGGVAERGFYDEQGPITPAIVRVPAQRSPRLELARDSHHASKGRPVSPCSRSIRTHRAMLSWARSPHCGVPPAAGRSTPRRLECLRVWRAPSPPQQASTLSSLHRSQKPWSAGLVTQRTSSSLSLIPSWRCRSFDVAFLPTWPHSVQASQHFLGKRIIPPIILTWFGYPSEAPETPQLTLSAARLSGRPVRSGGWTSAAQHVTAETSLVVSSCALDPAGPACLY